MAFLGKSERVVYESKNLFSGLIDIVAYTFKPDGIMVGPFPLIELPFLLFRGIYYFDIATTIMDPEGEWIISIVSPTEHYRTSYKVRFDLETTSGSSSSADVSDVFGFIDDVDEICGMIEPVQDIEGFIDQNFQIVGNVDESTDIIGFVNFDNDVRGDILCS